MNFARVKNSQNLIRDLDSKAILNTDLHALNKYKEERDFKMKLNRMVEEHEQVKNELSEIKSLLLKVLEQR